MRSRIINMCSRIRSNSSRDGRIDSSNCSMLRGIRMCIGRNVRIIRNINNRINIIRRFNRSRNGRNIRRTRIHNRNRRIIIMTSRNGMCRSRINRAW